MRTSSFRSQRSGFTLVELLVVIAIIGVLIALLLPAVQQAREAARRSECSNHMKQVGLGLHNYHDTHKVFPPGWISMGSGSMNHKHAWAVHLLPFIEQTALYDNIDPQGQNITSDVDKGGAIVSAYVCPSSILPERSYDGYGKSNYLGCQGWENNDADTGGIFNQNSKVSFKDITDGTSNTVMVGEADGSKPAGDKAFPVWVGTPDNSSVARRAVLRRGSYTVSINTNCNNATNGCHPAVYSSQHPGGAQHLFCDASVQFIPETIEMGSTNSPSNSGFGTYMRLITRNDGKVIGQY
ncbi:DUF1559 domain-containing protein [Bremerella sp. JC770]|uniref:DUF1559 domain-containing protein n=1 Tax=Bremerella sp. JC770 TaxID=3232137 RepID=UPI00345AF095